MILRIQSIVFLAIGFLCWHGVDDFVRTAKKEAKSEILVSLPLTALTQIRIGEI